MTAHEARLSWAFRLAVWLKLQHALGRVLEHPQPLTWWCRPTDAAPGPCAAWLREPQAAPLILVRVEDLRQWLRASVGTAAEPLLLREILRDLEAMGLFLPVRGQGCDLPHVVRLSAAILEVSQ